MKEEQCFYIIMLLLMIIFPIKAENPHRQLQSNQFAISNQRSPQLAQHCNNVNRDGLYSKYWNTGVTPYTAQFEQSFTLDETVFNEFLQLNIAGINTILKTNTWGYTTSIAMALVGLAIMAIATPIMTILIFCPMDSCLRKKLTYTKFQYTWPAVVLFLLGMAVIACCSVGMLSGYSIYQGYQEISCSGTIVFDDAINGNINAAKSSFFAGSSMIASELTKFNNNSGKIFTSLSKLSSKQPYFANSMNLMSQSLQNISQVPNTTGSLLNLKYNTPLISSTPTGQIDSTFPSLLGTKDTNGSLTKQAYDGIKASESTISTIANGVDTVMLSQYTYWNYTEVVIIEANKTSKSLFQSLLLMNDITKTVPMSSKVQYIEFIFYGIIAGVTVLLLLSMLCFMKWDMMNCRYCLYFFGFILFLGTVSAFALWLVFGFSSAVAYSGCNYLDQSVSNPTSFANSMQKLGTNPTVAKQMSVCLSGQSGNFVGSLVGASSSTFLQNMTSTMINIDNFNGKRLSDSIGKAYAPLNIQLAAYSSSQILDVSDASTISDLRYISNPKNYPSCSRGNFQSDSWIPHLNLQGNKVPCLAPEPKFSVDNLTCSNPSAFMTANLGCKGCIGTYSMLYYSSSYTDAYSYLMTRYSDCPQFNSDLSNIWNNFYLIKMSTLAPVLARQSTASQSVNAVKQDMTSNVDPLVSNTLNQLYNSSGSVMNPRYGLLGGLNCGVIGEDILVFKAAVCRNTFSYSYFHRIIMSILACCLAVLLCCNTCVLFRKKKDIYNSINFPSDDNNDGKARVQAQVAPLTDARLRNRYY